MTDAILAGAVLAAMAALGIHDARRAMVDPRMALALLGAAAAWRFLGNPDDTGAWTRLAGGVLGAALGVAAVMVPIAAAQLLGRRWPLYPGDAMLLGAFGFLLGVPGLAWTMLLGSAFALVHRFCVQRRRGRPFRKGLVPLGPGMCAGAAVVFLCIDCGVAFAGDRVRPERDGARQESPSVEALPLAARAAMEGEARLPATELAPALPALPAALAAREVSLEARERLSFPALVRRLAAAADVTMTIEERPARVMGGAATLAAPPPLRLSWRGTLAGLVDRVAVLAGYDWSWRDGAVVFHRYWDTEQRGPADADAGAGDPGAGTGDDAGGGWTADPARHRTLRGVLEDWAARAGWTLVWTAERDYGLGASASFAGSFLEAADLLLSGPATSRALDARAYRANRHLVVGDAGGAGW